MPLKTKESPYKETIMKDFKIEGTQSIPDIFGDWAQGVLKISGDSYPENSFELFEPLLQWVERYLDQDGSELTLQLNLLYLNTSSVKIMMDIFDLLEVAHTQGKKVNVIWSYDEENERVAELAEDFKEDCTFPFDIRSFESN